MQDSSQPTSDHQKLVNQLKAIFRDHTQPVGSCQEHFHVVCENHWFLRNRTQLEQQSKNAEPGDILVILLDASRLGKIKRLAAFAVRGAGIKKIIHILNANGIGQLDSYALYPNVENVQIIYQRKTDAAHYAEKQLLNPGSGKLSKLLNRVLLPLFGSSPLVDVVAVVGRKS